MKTDIRTDSAKAVGSITLLERPVKNLKINI
jgi:hypothetical protein